MGTIDTKGLGDVWLPAYRQELRGLKWVEKREPKDYHSQGWADWHHAKWLIEQTIKETVSHIVKRGGLLLLVP